MGNPIYTFGDKISDGEVNGEIKSISINNFKEGYLYGIESNKKGFTDILEDNVIEVNYGSSSKVNFDPKYNLGNLIKGRDISGEEKCGEVHAIGLIDIDSEFIYFFDDKNNNFGTSLYESNIFEARSDK